MNSYQERKAARADRFRQYADNAAGRSDAAHKGVRQIADHIPFGQPILVGHHSEGRARRDANRIHSGMQTAIAESDRAAYWRWRAEAIENDTSISIYDPEAVELLTAKIAQLEEQRESLKRINKAARTGKLNGLTDAEVVAVTRLQEAGPDWAGRVRIAPYVLTNLGANIRRYQGRLAQAQAAASKKWTPEERREFAIEAYCRDRHPSMRAGVLARVGDWARGRGDKGEWREFKRLLVHVVTDDEIDGWLGEDRNAE